ncbi:alpha/beta fold hydrolase [Aerococcus agrisoli]|uniref:Alpha/beta fold hydrolase n=1 Tax=Aerococcus agrisoli TaxID=2487350 RepID=A0A3N4H2E4_9LACT|nr:alpha/beta fold hydrolase [Aerococcus agrisoli]RPA64980.1 alpha/beta fold hydrolase [Aerococcus agrisoli]
MQTKLPEPFFFEGNEKAIILFHAFTGTSNDVRMLGRRLNREGYTVYAPQLTGHATEDVFNLVAPGNPQTWLTDGQKAYDELKKRGYQKIAAFGLSLGGTIATSVLLNNDVIGGGVFNTPIVTNQPITESNVPGSFMLFADQMLKRNGLNDNEIQAQKPQLQTQLTDTLQGIAAINASLRNRINEIQVPFYIAASGQDELVDPTAGEQFADAITTAPVDLNVFPSATHVITVGKYHHEFETTVIDYLTTLNWE